VGRVFLADRFQFQPNGAVDAVNAGRQLEMVHCPECGQVASIEWERAAGGVPLWKIRCIARHWFLMPAEDVARIADLESCQNPWATT
jgi:hypothetical protein